MIMKGFDFFLAVDPCIRSCVMSSVFQLFTPSLRVTRKWAENSLTIYDIIAVLKPLCQIVECAEVRDLSTVQLNNFI